MISVGIDEAGRGCWAGPLVASAVILDKPIIGLTDSKLLSPKKREFLAEEIKEVALAYGLGWVWPSEVDEMGLTAATKLAMQLAVKDLDHSYDEIIIDGNYNYLPDYLNVRVMIGADSLVPSVSAASILAKVSRDKYMKELGSEYEPYKFEKHVGYGTSLHRELIMKYGISDIHRKSYRPIQKLMREVNV